MTFRYGSKEIDYIKSRDRRLGAVIDRIGRIRREMHPDLFSCDVRNIADQQVSGYAANTAVGFHLMAAWRAFTSGKWRAGRCLTFQTLP